MNFRKHAQRRGFTMIEMIVVLAILSATFVGIMVFMDAIVKGLYSETTEADQQTRMASRMFDMIAEIRQASLQSMPATFGVATTPPSITFKLPVGTSPVDGSITWGNTIKYYLKANGKYIDRANTIPAATIWRDEIPAAAGSATISTVIEDMVPLNVPPEIIDNVPAANPYFTPPAVPIGTPNIYGFNVYVVNNTTVTITVHKTGDTRVNLGTTQNSTQSTNGTLATSIYTGTYYLRNPSIAVTPPSKN